MRQAIMHARNPADNWLDGDEGQERGHGRLEGLEFDARMMESEQDD
jgi:hypothetical protein